MADLVQIISQPGPLPIGAKVAIETDAPTIVTLAGSVFSADMSEMVGIVLFIDGKQVANAQIFANPMEQHLAVVPVTFSYTFPDTPDQIHTFGLDTLTGPTMSDGNDFYVVTVQY
jgi:hypothetical protein